jgi:F-type H+-transporting ATPase subunit b
MEGLGIQLPQIVFYIISFLIAMYVLNKFVFSPVAKVMTKREKEIDAALKAKEEADSKVAHIEAESEAIINKAKEEARGILEKAATEIEPQKESILKAAHQKAEEIVASSQKQALEIIESAKVNADKEAVVILEKIVKKSLSNLQISEDIANPVLHKIIERI